MEEVLPELNLFNTKNGAIEVAQIIRMCTVVTVLKQLGPHAFYVVTLVLFPSLVKI